MTGVMGYRSFDPRVFNNVQQIRCAMTSRFGMIAASAFAAP